MIHNQKYATLSILISDGLAKAIYIETEGETAAFHIFI
jgi:hypothetical protein